ncbi:hypothetical protein NK638_01130 [Psychrobacter sp. A3]|uniref:hypothetical protein n=1 Tax=Psychrobacter sp. A3 TaxID=2992754 RepID=UPI00237BF55C|nr:hypothetical protein [Psychrobacter sp. A3]MDE0490155.1 hypothetical protein [Psychrobacter sp. A3]
MYKFLPDKAKSHDTAHDSHMNKTPSPNRKYVAMTVLAATLNGALLLGGCQQQTETAPVVDDSQATEQVASEDSKPVPQSESAAARIEQFEPIYVTQMQSLQRRLQAEYESLQAADSTQSAEDLLLNSADTAGDNTTNSGDAATAQNRESGDEAAADINTSTEVGERDLTVLKRISLEPRKPVMQTEDEIIDSYQQATAALYQPVITPLSADEVDTLINIATLVPQLFEHAEIAGRLSAKSPALARLIIQHQVWEQIEAQQVIDMQQMKLNQQQEFEALMAKFNETIKGYDEQIAKYEQTLKAFE